MSYEDLISNEKCSLIYIASNHSTHSFYAKKALEYGKDVYVEKPLSVDVAQFNSLLKILKTSSSNIYVGYNRPFSKSIKKISNLIVNKPITLNCFISGHKINSDHWYRDPSEGTRVCGNLGHWIDLTVHLLMKKKQALPEIFDITVVRANDLEIDDNLTVIFKTSDQDLITITLSSREEPFEGIKENINLLNGNLNAYIDDFRKLTLHNGDKKTVKRYFPKDVGHKLSVMQPFQSKKRNFKELEYSTFITLLIADMVKKNTLEKKVILNDHIDKDGFYKIN